MSAAGIPKEEYESKEFKDFASKYRSNIPITEVFEDFRKMQPKKEYKTMGSMKNSTSDDSTIKDYYTPEEARRFTKKDYDNNPALFKAVEASMLKWKR